MTHTPLTTNGKIIAEAIVKILQANNVVASIETTYRDYGQDWTYETIIANTRNGSYQVLNPRQVEEINNCTFNFSELNEILVFATKVR